MSADETASTGLKALGKTPSVIPGFQNNMMAFMGKRVLSRKSNVKMFGGMMRKMLRIEES